MPGVKPRLVVCKAKLLLFAISLLPSHHICNCLFFFPPWVSVLEPMSFFAIPNLNILYILAGKFTSISPLSMKPTGLGGRPQAPGGIEKYTWFLLLSSLSFSPVWAVVTCWHLWVGLRPHPAAGSHGYLWALQQPWGSAVCSPAAVAMLGLCTLYILLYFCMTCLFGSTFFLFI